MNKSARRLRSQDGAALIIVLAFIVLLAALVTAYFTRTVSDRQTAHGSFNQSRADQASASAVGIIIGDLRQEIKNGSTAVQVSPTPASGSAYVYVPTANGNMVPQRNAPGTIANLIRRSVRSDPIAAPGVSSKASDVNSTDNPSANGRSITKAQWNRHYLVPKSNANDDKTDPDPAFTSPDWVMLTAEWGADRLSTPTTDDQGRAVTPVGRFAYAIYDEGGLLDLNVAGYPSGTTTGQAGRKGSLAFADLTTLPYPLPNASPTYQVDKLVGWRNYATTQASNDFPNANFADNFRSDTTRAAAYFSWIVSSSNGYLTARSTPNPSPYPWNGRTDQMFLSRQQLISFRSSTQSSSNALQDFATFTRETNAPSWSPAPTTTVNPDFRTLRVTGSFTRNDGSTALLGEPLVKKRFALQRLDWLTYKGPSGPSAANPTGRVSTDPDMAILINTYGMTSDYLQKGTDANILSYFGLTWDTANERWNYVGHGGGSTPISGLATLGSLTGTREPDFFELLQAGILDSSVGVSAASDPSLPASDGSMPTAHQQSKMLHLLTIGANLIAQARTDAYPVRIACMVGGTVMEAVGSPRLPYINSLAAAPVAGTGVTGGVNWMVVPNLWDPYRNTYDLRQPTPVPQYPRPQVRLRVNGTAQFGTVATPTPSPTPSPSPTP